MSKKYKILLIIICTIFIIGLIVVGFYIYNNNITDVNGNNNNINNNIEYYIISSEEKNAIELFFNDETNRIFLEFNYNSPSELFDYKPAESIEYYGYSILIYAFSSSKYVYTKPIGEFYFGPPNDYIKFNDILLFLKDKTNYDFSEDIIRKKFGNGFEYDTESDSLFVGHTDSDYYGDSKIKIVFGSKKDDKYYVKVNIEEHDIEDIDVVLTKKGDNYYFYSCNLNDIWQYDSKKIEELEKYINLPENAYFINVEYSLHNDFPIDGDKKQLLAYSISRSKYAKKADKSIRDKYGVTDDSLYLISKNNFEDYLSDKTRTIGLFENVFEYDQESNSYLIRVEKEYNMKEVKILEGYGSKYTSYLKLDNGLYIKTFVNGEGFKGSSKSVNVF